MLMAIFLGGAKRKDYLFRDVRLLTVRYDICATLVASHLSVQTCYSLSSNISFPIRIYSMILLAGSLAPVGTRPAGRVESFPLRCVHLSCLYL
jgi:hypothetical protein